MDSPYSDILLKHHRSPVNAGDPMQMPVQKSARNRSCGDSVTLGIEYDESNQRIKSIVHHAEGCMLCRASASILCLVVQNRNLDEIQELRSYVDEVCSIGNPDKSPQLPTFLSVEHSHHLESLLEVRKYPTRYKCVKLAWSAITTF